MKTDSLHSKAASSPYTWESLNNLLDQSGGSAYVLDINQFIDNVSRLRVAFSSRYPRIGIGYSYKTNYLPRLCMEADKMMLYAEVVSGMEYDLARLLGVKGENIIFNGPSKSRSELIRAFTEGALVNIDSLSEARLVSSLRLSTSEPMRVGLRCNLDLSWNGRKSRFGLSEPGGELGAAWDLLAPLQNIRIEGLHCHTSFDRSAESYGRRTKRLIELASQLFGNNIPQFIDIGGGMCGPMPEALALQFKSPPPDYEEYADEICSAMQSHYGSEGPELILEPGVGLVGNVVDYIYRVEHIKQVDDRRIAMTSGAAHQIKIVPNDINLPTTIVRSPENRGLAADDTPTDLAGFTCLEHDIIYRGLTPSPLQGDILVTSSAGAYSMVTSSDFIRCTPMVVEPANEKEWKVLKKKTTTEDLINLFEW